MHRGTIFIITKDKNNQFEIQKSTEFNGGMGLDCYGKAIYDMLKDLKEGRRSTMERINKSFIEPTLKDCVAGDLALVLPHRIVTNIIEGLEKLDKIIPGVNNDETLLYGPEIKFFSNEIITNNNMQVGNENMYCIGDGAGKAGNIVTAAATGLIAARDILKKENYNNA